MLIFLNFVLFLRRACFVMSDNYLFGVHRVKAKYMVPRDPHLRSSYRMSKFQRPKLKIHGVWAFGHVLRLAILEEGSYHGSSMVREVLALTLEDVVAECQRKGRAPPDTVVIVGDNTVKELKNATCLLYAASLVNHARLKHLGRRFSKPSVFWLMLHGMSYGF